MIKKLIPRTSVSQCRKTSFLIKTVITDADVAPFH